MKIIKNLIALIRVFLSTPFILLALIFLTLYLLIGGEDSVGVCEKLASKFLREVEECSKQQ
jgi:hypothetical protein